MFLKVSGSIGKDCLNQLSTCKWLFTVSLLFEHKYVLDAVSHPLKLRR